MHKLISSHNILTTMCIRCLPPEIVLEVLKHLEWNVLEYLGEIVPYVHKIVLCNLLFLRHLQLKVIAPRIARQIAPPEDRLRALEADPQLQRCLLTRVPAIYVALLFNRYVLDHLLLVRYLDTRAVRDQLSGRITHRPSRELLEKRGILQRPLSAIRSQIVALQKRFLEDLLQGLMKRRRVPGRVAVVERVSQIEAGVFG